MIIFLILIFGAGLGFFLFFLIKTIVAPQKVATLASFVKQNKNSQAIRMAKNILTKDSTNADAHYLLAKAYRNDNKPELALMEYKTVSNISDFTGICHEVEFRNEIASLFMQFNHYEEALKEYLLLLKKEPLEANHYYNAGFLFEKRKKGMQAIKYYRKCIELNARHSDAWFRLGMLYFAAKRNNDARPALEKALKIKPDNFKAHYYLGRMMKEVKDYQGAVDSFEKSQKEPEFKIKSLIERGNCYIAMKQYERAITELQRAIKLSDNSSSKETLFSHYFLSTCYEKQRDLDKAIEHWEKIYTIQADFKDVAEKLSQYQELRSDDNMKEYLTSSDERFAEMCKSIVEVTGHTINDYTAIPTGSTVIAVEKTKSEWRNTRKFPKLMQFLRIPENIEVPRVRDFHEEMKKKGFTKGIMFSSSQFSRSAIEFSESRPLDLYGKEKLQEFMTKANFGS